MVRDPARAFKGCEPSRVRIGDAWREFDRVAFLDPLRGRPWELMSGPYIGPRDVAMNKDHRTAGRAGRPAAVSPVDVV